MNTDTEFYSLSDLGIMLTQILRGIERIETALQNHSQNSAQNENFKGDFVRNLKTGLGGDYRGGSDMGFKGKREGGEIRGGKGEKIAPNEVSTTVVTEALKIMECYLSEMEFSRANSATGRNAAAKEVQKLLNAGYSAAQVVQAVRDASNEPFWRKQFRSIAKLTRKNKDNVPYIDVFLALNQTKHKLPTNRPRIIV